MASRTPVTIYPAGAGLDQPANASGSLPYPPIQLAQSTGSRNATPFLPQTPLVQTPYPTPIDLDVMLEEAQTGRIMFGVGVNSDSGLLGNIVIDEQNFDLFRWPTGIDDWLNGTAFRGAGQHFRLEALPGTQLQRYSMSFAEPYLFGSSVSLGLSAFYYERQYLNWDERRWGGRGSLGYIFPEQPDLSTTFSARYEEINILKPTVPTPFVLREVEGENQLIAFRWDIAHDTRDNAYLPSEGHLIELAFDQAIGTWYYPRFVGDARRYFVLRERPDGSGRHVLGLAGTLGVTGSDTPIYDNFFAGGFATIRGFFFREASPKINNVIVGGQFEILTSAEYLFPLTASDNVFGAFFLDVGTVERTVNITWSDVRISPGFELRLTVPALGPVPLALGFAVPVQHAPTDRIRNFHFFVGLSR
jgi:outer membrane protein insertion porin family